MSRLKMTFASNRYDRTTPLADGTVTARGIDLNVLLFDGVEQVFWRMLRHHEFDISEMSLSSYLMMRDRGQDDLIAIPVFPSRVFRQSSIFVREDSNLERLEQLAGATVGVPEYQMTAAVWVKGILQDEYGVHPRDIIWRNGGLDQAGRIEKLPLELPSDISLNSIPVDETLNQSLLDGKIDALVTARPPSAFLDGTHRVRRLVRNHQEVEADYYKRTKIFPPMHTVVIKRDLYEANRWIAMSLFGAFQEALALSDPLKMFGTGHIRYAIPFIPAWIEYLQEEFGGIKMWQYGVEPNRKALQTLIRYQREQGLIKNELRPEEMFAAETLDSYRN
jgi:4,5-dihydroxyphthalate decarboxylase